MPRHDTSDAMRARASGARARMRGTMTLFVFGLGILAFLVAIGRPEWFHIRPASGGAVAMSLAADQQPASHAATAPRVAHN